MRESTPKNKINSDQEIFMILTRTENPEKMRLELRKFSFADKSKLSQEQIERLINEIAPQIKGASYKQMLDAGIHLNVKSVGPETRSALRGENGESISITSVGEKETPKWQNSHFHKGIIEDYTVLKGEMVMTWIGDDGDYKIQKYKKDEVVTMQPNVVHNVIILPGSSISTTKRGLEVGNPEKKDNDWYDGDKDFDKWCKELDISNIK